MRPLFGVCATVWSCIAAVVCSLHTGQRFVLLTAGEAAASTNRRDLLNRFAVAVPCALTSGFSCLPIPARADLNSASESGVPLLGRFERLTGANAFIGSWRYEGTAGPPSGELVFLKNGDVELRSLDDQSSVIGVGAVPWKYVSPRGGDTMVTVSFTLDVEGQDDVLIYRGILDSAGGPGRRMEGTIETGRAEIGARGGGPRNRVGSFSAQIM